MSVIRSPLMQCPQHTQEDINTFIETKLLRIEAYDSMCQSVKDEARTSGRRMLKDLNSL